MAASPHLHYSHSHPPYAADTHPARQSHPHNPDCTQPEWQWGRFQGAEGSQPGCKELAAVEEGSCWFVGSSCPEDTGPGFQGVEWECRRERDHSRVHMDRQQLVPRVRGVHDVLGL